jgi:hypothetical protein
VGDLANGDIFWAAEYLSKKGERDFAVRRNLYACSTFQPLLFNIDEGEDHG